MISHLFRGCMVLCGLVAITGCGLTTPTEPDINESLRASTEDAVRSAAGPWSGQVAGAILYVEFSLTQAPDGRLAGSGTMFGAQGGAVPITVAGSYRQPNLVLTFTGMVFDGREVSGTFEGTYDSFMGVLSTLRLSADGYSRSLSLMLSEGTPVPPSLGGRLTDALTGAPVVGATVSVQGRSVTSSQTGHYGFDPNLAAGTFTVTVSHPMYVEVVQDVQILPYRMVDFKLRPK